MVRRYIYTVTRNQIAYWELQEAARANQAREAENYRHNYTVEGQNLLNLRESERHNRELESINIGSLHESIRHNKAGEELDRYRTDQQIAANLYSAELSSAASRYAAALNSAASRYASDVNAATQLEVSARNVLLEESRIAENVRHNVATEDLTNTQLTDNRNLTQQRIDTEKTRVQNEYDLRSVSNDISWYNALRNAEFNIQNIELGYAKVNQEAIRNAISGIGQLGNLGLILGG